MVRGFVVIAFISTTSHRDSWPAVLWAIPAMDFYATLQEYIVMQGTP